MSTLNEPLIEYETVHSYQAETNKLIPYLYKQELGSIVSSQEIDGKIFENKIKIDDLRNFLNGYFIPETPKEKPSILKGKITKLQEEDINNQLNSLRDEWEKISNIQGSNEKQSILRQEFLVKLYSVPKELRNIFLEEQALKAKKIYKENNDWRDFQSGDFIEY